MNTNKASYKHISAVRLITDTLQLLHMDLFGPTNIRSIDQNRGYQTVFGFCFLYGLSGISAGHANEKNLIQVLKIYTDDNVADLLTRAFDGPRFEYLVVHIGMVDMLSFLLDALFLLSQLSFCCAQFDIAGWLVSATSHLVSAGSLQSCWCNNVSAA
ncbi:hypothetical protein Tco_1458344 [Tanacetum coccineum]